MSELEDLKASLCADIKEALSNPIKPTREQADQAVDAVFDWIKPFVDYTCERMVKEGIFERDAEPTSIEIKPIYVKRRNQTPPSDDLNVITIYIGGKRKRRAHFKPHLRRRLKAVKR